MPDINIRIRGSSQWVIDLLDKFVAEEGFESRNQLINHILTTYVTTHSAFFAASLPEITRELCQSSIDEITALVKTHMKNIEITYDHIAQIADELRTVISSEE